MYRPECTFSFVSCPLYSSSRLTIHKLFSTYSPDTTYIYVNVGFGFHLQMTLEEAKAFVLKKEKQLQR